MRFYSEHYPQLRLLFVPLLARFHDTFSIMMPNRALSSCIALIAGLVMGNAFSFELALFGSLMIIATYSSQAVYNNIRDVEGDRINAPHRPLARGSLTVDFAWGLLGFLVLCGFAFAVLAGPFFLLANMMFISVGFIYSRYTKSMGLLSYATLVSSHLVLPLVVGYLVMNPLDYKILAIAAFIYITEILAISIKDYKDFEGDRATGIKTLPVRMGLENASRLTFVGMLLPLFLSWIPWALLNLSVVFLVFYMASGLLKMHMGARLVKDPTPSVAGNILKNYRYALMLQMFAWCFS